MKLLYIKHVANMQLVPSAELAFKKLACEHCPGGHLGQFLLGICRWPLRTPTPL